MAKISWGTKRTCPCGNGVRFYDLNKEEIECPSCGESINIEKLSLTTIENNLRKKPVPQILGENKNVGIKDKNLSKNEVGEIIDKKVKDEEKKN